MVSVGFSGHFGLMGFVGPYRAYRVFCLGLRVYRACRVHRACGLFGV